MASELQLDVVIPVHNEELGLAASVRELHATLSELLRKPWRITIADNGSTDATPLIAQGLALEFPEVTLLSVREPGRGRALKTAWLASDAEIVAYVDADLSTDLRALAPLIAPLVSGHSDLAIGTRLTPTSRVVRGAKREFISRSYNAILKYGMGVSITDAQCGFKAMRRDVAERLLPLVQDTGWFFDTELLVIAERSGLRIHEVPVDWIDDENSSVDVVTTAIADLKGLARIARSLADGTIPVETLYAEIGRHPFERPKQSFLGQVVRFALVGGASTVAYALLYLLLQTVMPAQVANFVALLSTAVANTWANRRFTFGVRGRPGAARHHVQGLVVFAIAWAITAGALGSLHAVMPAASPQLELVVLTGANLLGTAVRFVLLRVWVFRNRAVPATLSLAPRDEMSRDRVLGR